MIWRKRPSWSVSWNRKPALLIPSELFKRRSLPWTGRALGVGNPAGILSVEGPASIRGFVPFFPGTGGDVVGSGLEGRGGVSTESGDVRVKLDPRKWLVGQ